MRAVLSYHYNVRQQHWERASCFPSKGKYRVLAPKKLAMKYLAVCFPWKRAIKQLLEQYICIWIAHVQSQPVCKYTRSRLSWNKTSLPFRNNSMPFLSIFLSHLSPKSFKSLKTSSLPWTKCLNHFTCLMLITLKLGRQKAPPAYSKCLYATAGPACHWFLGGWLICLPVAMCSAVLGPQDAPDIRIRQLFSEATSWVHVTG